MKKIAAIFLFITPFFLSAQQWDTLTPQGIPVNLIERTNFHYVSGNTLYSFIQNPDTVIFDLPITDTEIEGFDLSMLITVGGGSYSDALYYIDPYNNELTLIDFFFKPQFVDEFNDTLYLGCQGGLYYSSDRFTWNIYNSFAPDELVLNYYELESNKAVIVQKPITKNDYNDYIYHSEDGGETWVADTLPGKVIDSDFYIWTGKLAFILLDDTGSTSIYESYDNGNTLSYINTFSNLNLIDIIGDNSFALAHSRDTSIAYGVSLYYPELNYHTFINDNLPSRNILFLEQFPMDCFNLTVGTDVGAYEVCGMVTDIVDNPVSNEIKISPNPTSDFISIETDIHITSPIKVIVTNIEGQTVKQITFNKYHNNNPVIINTSMLQQGYYAISIYSQSEWIGSQKFIKQ